MKQIGNLAVVCARRQDVLLQVGSEKVCVHVGAGPKRNTLHAAWDDDDAIRRIVHELNFGRYAAGRNGLPCNSNLYTPLSFHVLITSSKENLPDTHTSDTRNYSKQILKSHTLYQ